jgi:hypothetical protein
LERHRGFSARVVLDIPGKGAGRVNGTPPAPARIVIIVDVAIILGGILLVAWLVDGQAS